MSCSTFDVIRTQEVWKSNGAVTFPNDSVTESSTGEQLRAGYYPCAGVEFRWTPVIRPYQSKPAPWYIDGKVGSTQPLPVDRELRSMYFNITNPRAAYVSEVREAIRNARPPVPHFPPQVLMDETYCGLFQQLEFTERSSDALVSDVLYLPEIKLYDRDGNEAGHDGPHTVVFVITHYLNAGKFAMVQRAIWDNGAYEALYGCC